MAGYYQSGTTCVATSVTNCSETDASGNCIHCTWPYVLTKTGTCTNNCTNATTVFQQTAGNRCVSIGASQSSTSTNTLTASSTCAASELKCLRCRMSIPSNLNMGTNGEFGIASLATSTTNTSIDGCTDVSKTYQVRYCMFYNSAMMCDQCFKGYVLTADSYACVEDSNGPSNCRQLGDLYGKTCKRCHDSYYADDEDTCKSST